MIAKTDRTVASAATKSKAGTGLHGTRKAWESVRYEVRMLRSDDARQRQRLLRQKPRKMILIKFIKIGKADEIERKTGR